MLICQLSKVSTALLVAAFLTSCSGVPQQASQGSNAPQISMVVPQSSGVGTNREVAVVFSKRMDPASINTSTFVVAGVNGTVTYDAVNMIGAFKPAVDYALNTTYNASITVGCRDISGIPLAAPFEFSFTTRATEDASPPDIVAVNLVAGATCVPLDQKISISGKTM